METNREKNAPKLSGRLLKRVNLNVVANLCAVLFILHCTTILYLTSIDVFERINSLFFFKFLA
jgi:hypothetical protein